MLHKSLPLMLVLAACLAMPLAASAAPAEPESVVSGTGTATIEKPADTMRLQVQIVIEGSSLKDALDKLKARTESLKTGLVKLGAAEKSFAAEDTQASDGDSPTDRRAAVERAMRDRMTAGRGGPAASAPAAHYTAACTIRAEWTLKSDSTGAMILAAQEIKTKIKESKLLEAPKSAAQSEADEEAAMAAATTASESGQAPNEPVYLFVAKVTDAESAKAMSEAFAKAKAAATNLAKAAGADLGSLRSIQGDASPSEDSYAAQEYMGSQYYRQLMMRSRYGGSEKEAFSAQPGKVTMQVMVQASFLLK